MPGPVFQCPVHNLQDMELNFNLLEWVFKFLWMVNEKHYLNNNTESLNYEINVILWEIKQRSCNIS
jgi:hypothetical protein